MRTLIPAILLAAVTTFGTVAQAAPPGMKTSMNAGVAAELTNQGPGGLLGRRCAAMNKVPVWGGLRANNPKVPTMLKAKGLEAKCEGGMITEVTLTKGFGGKLPRNTNWSMTWKDVFKTLKKAGVKDRTVKDKKSPGGPMVMLRAKSGTGDVVWRWSDSKGKGMVASITYSK